MSGLIVENNTLPDARIDKDIACRTAPPRLR